MMLEERLRNHGLEARQLPTADARALRQRWRETFAQRVKSATGQWTHHGIDWHAFSWGFTVALRGAEAEQAYWQRDAKSFYVLGEDPDEACACSARALPDLHTHKTDHYVCATDLGWTMVFTHEDDSGVGGPFFCTPQLAKRPPPQQPAATRASRSRRRR